MAPALPREADDTLTAESDMFKASNSQAREVQQPPADGVQLPLLQPVSTLQRSFAGSSRLLSIEAKLSQFTEQLQAIEATAKHVESEYNQAGQVSDA